MATNHSIVLIDAVRRQLASDESLADFIAKNIFISKDAAYRRISGKVGLSFEEAIHICKILDISIDQIVQIQREKVMFEYLELFSQNPPIAIDKYYRIVEKSIRSVKNRNGKIFVSAMEIPIAFIIHHPILMSFKLYCWKRDFTNFRINNSSRFKIQSNKYEKFYLDFFKLYSMADTHEIWSANTIDSLINSLKIYYEQGIISVQEMSILIKELLILINEIEDYAFRGQKDGGGRFFLYITPFNFSNNMYLLASKKSKDLYINFESINTIFTNNTTHCNRQMEWFEQVISTSIMVNNNMDVRKMWFGRFREKADALFKLI